MPNPDHIDPVFARGLKNLRKLTWDQVGVELARQQFRDVAFRGTSIKNVVLQFEKLNRSDDD